MASDQSFLEQIAQDPGDTSRRLVYADWLEERGDSRADYLRLQVQLQTIKKGKRKRSALKRRLRELHKHLDQEWLVALSRPRIENCDQQPLKFKFKCPKQWEHLANTHDPKVRHCEQCKNPVYYCDTIEEANERGMEGECVAIDLGIERQPGDFTGRMRLGVMGMLMPVDDSEAQQS